jgi:hypothetical protein
MQYGRSFRKVVEKIDGITKRYYMGRWGKFLSTAKTRSHRHRVKQDLRKYDEDSFDDTPLDSSETFTAYDIW